MRVSCNFLQESYHLLLKFKKDSRFFDKVFTIGLNSGKFKPMV